jgi:hypothetical protein
MPKIEISLQERDLILTALATHEEQVIKPMIEKCQSVSSSGLDYWIARYGQLSSFRNSLLIQFKKGSV